LDKFRDKDADWREHIERVEEDKLKVAVRYRLQEDETERGEVRVERVTEWVDGTVA
jgi:hypothetical protein